MYTYNHPFWGVHEYNVEVKENHQCMTDCAHFCVCQYADWMARFCENYDRAKEDKIEPTACWSCKHYYVMNEPKESVPCFKCEHYLDKDKVKKLISEYSY